MPTDNTENCHPENMETNHHKISVIDKHTDDAEVEGNMVCIRLFQQNEVYVEKRPYTLNLATAIDKKLQALERPAVGIKPTDGGIVISFNTVAFELLRPAMSAYYEDFKSYEHLQVNKITVEEESGYIPEIKFKVVFPSKKTCYTVNQYNTTTKLLVNGRGQARFCERDLPAIFEQMNFSTEMIAQITDALNCLQEQRKKTKKNGDNNMPQNQTINKQNQIKVTSSKSPPGNSKKKKTAKGKVSPSKFLMLQRCMQKIETEQANIIEGIMCGTSKMAMTTYQSPSATKIQEKPTDESSEKGKKNQECKAENNDKGSKLNLSHLAQEEEHEVNTSMNEQIQSQKKNVTPKGNQKKAETPAETSQKEGTNETQREENLTKEKHVTPKGKNQQTKNLKHTDTSVEKSNKNKKHVPTNVTDHHKNSATHLETGQTEENTGPTDTETSKQERTHEGPAEKSHNNEKHITPKETDQQQKNVTHSETSETQENTGAYRETGQHEKTNKTHIDTSKMENTYETPVEKSYRNEKYVTPKETYQQQENVKHSETGQIEEKTKACRKTGRQENTNRTTQIETSKQEKTYETPVEQSLRNEKHVTPKETDLQQKSVTQIETGQTEEKITHTETSNQEKTYETPAENSHRNENSITLTKPDQQQKNVTQTEIGQQEKTSTSQVDTIKQGKTHETPSEKSHRNEKHITPKETDQQQQNVTHMEMGQTEVKTASNNDTYNSEEEHCKTNDWIKVTSRKVHRNKSPLAKVCSESPRNKTLEPRNNMFEHFIGPNPPFTIIRGETNELSNLYLLPQPITYQGCEFRSIEHAYKSEKVKYFNREELKLVIEEMENPKEMMIRIDKELKHSENMENKQKWNENKVRIMKELLFLKFQACEEFRNTVLLSNGKFVEATGHPFWGSGLSLKQTLVINPNEWPGKNILGELLEDLRQSHSHLPTQVKSKPDLTNETIPSKEQIEIQLVENHARPGLDTDISVLQAKVRNLEKEVKRLEVLESEVKELRILLEKALQKSEQKSVEVSSRDKLESKKSNIQIQQQTSKINNQNHNPTTSHDIPTPNRIHSILTTTKADQEQKNVYGENSHSANTMTFGNRQDRRASSTNKGKVIEADYLIITDSICKNINPRRMYPSKQVYVHRLGGNKDIKEAMQVIETTRVKASVIHYVIGTNDLTKQSSMDDTLKNIQNLTEKTKRKMPNAKIIYSSVLPRVGHGVFNKKKDVFNLKLNSMSEKMQFQVLNLENPDLHKFERDGLHLTQKGLAWYVQQIKVVMNPLMNLGVYDRYNHLNSSQYGRSQNNKQYKTQLPYTEINPQENYSNVTQYQPKSSANPWHSNTQRHQQKTAFLPKSESHQWSLKDRQQQRNDWSNNNQQKSFQQALQFNSQPIPSHHRTPSSPNVNQAPMCSLPYHPYFQQVQSNSMSSKLQQHLQSNPQEPSTRWPVDTRHQESRWSTSSPPQFTPLSCVTNVPIFLPKNYQNYPPPTNW